MTMKPAMAPPAEASIMPGTNPVSTVSTAQVTAMIVSARRGPRISPKTPPGIWNRA